MSESSGAQDIRVRMKIGEVEIEIQCQEDQLQSAVDKVLRTVTERLKGMPITAERPGPQLRADTCKGTIQRLWSEGWFAVSRNLGEVHVEMARRGFHYDRTAVAHALIDLVKDSILAREGKARRYRYAQKRPP